MLCCARSLRQLKKEYQDLKAAQAATVVKAAAATSMPDNHSSDDEAEVVAAAEPDSAATAAAHSLSTALGSLTIGPTASGSRIPLRGVPVPEVHLTASIFSLYVLHARLIVALVLMYRHDVVASTIVELARSNETQHFILLLTNMVCDVVGSTTASMLNKPTAAQ